MSAHPATPVSVVIITLNEEALIERCIAGVEWADEVVIVDAGSTDRTRELAAARGAVVYEREWSGFSSQRNFGAAQASNDWILGIDADEVVTSELARSLGRVLASGPDPRDGYAASRRNDFLGVALPNTARPGRKSIRLYNRRHGEWDPSLEVHEVVRVPGDVHMLDGSLLHWNDFSLSELIDLYHRYALEEAAQLDRDGAPARVMAVLYRPIMRFVWHYLVRGEARVGERGLVHSALQGCREFMRYALLWELRQHPEFARRPRRRRSRYGGS
ncbi:MAG: glycosyltransferase family 2 protein [Solirubrobacterales bacterium]